ncbi:MAG: BMP family ABC transporter substrate-binding protein [Legionella sp.]|jgi:basic membrane lipoprotein Med (substrate-binding protein (PBP1-ABC) superfamily)
MKKILMSLCLYILPWFCFAISPLPQTTHLLILIPGSHIDHNYSQAAYEGIQTIQNKAYQITWIEQAAKLKKEAIKSIIQHHQARGYRVIIAIGDEFSQTVSELAPTFPKLIFFTTGSQAKGNNVITYCLDRIPQAGVLAGFIAAYSTKTNTVGFVGGKKLVDENEFIAYKNTIKDINPKIRVISTWTNDWFDTKKAAQATTDQINEHADLIVAGANTGSISAASKMKNVYIIGWMADVSDLNRSVVAGSIVIDFGKLYLMMLDSLKQKNVTAGTVIVKPSDRIWKFGRFGPMLSKAQKQKIINAHVHKMEHALKLYEKAAIPDRNYSLSPTQENCDAPK